MFHLNLKLKFTLTICCLLALSTVTLGWLFLLQVEETALRQLREKGGLFASGLAEDSELGVLTHNADLLRMVVHPLVDQEDLVYAGVADETGEILAERRDARLVDLPGWARPAGASEATSAPVALELPDGTPIYFLTMPVAGARQLPGGEEVGLLLGGGIPDPGVQRMGTVCVGVSAAGVARESRALRRGLALATLAVLVVGFVIAVFLVRVIVQPVKQLVHATQRIATGDLDVRLQQTGNDEITALARSFNRMAVNLDESRRALELSNAELEDKVQERTRDLKKAQSQLVQAEKMSVVGQLVSGVAHELNNPLAGVLGYSQLLQRKGVEENVARGLRKIEAEAERCKRIVQNLLIFARKHKPRKILLNLNEVVDAILEMRAYHLKVDNVIVVRDLDPALPPTMADMNQMQQVLMNIVNNAQQAMAERPGVERRLTVRTSSRPGGISVEISDTGGGIPPENLGKVFDPFFTTKEVGRGTGLGLSICYGIVEEHHGAIRVDSRPGEGTIFTIDLPVVAQVPIAPLPADPVGDLVAQATRTGRILLVDDEASILEIIGDVLRLDGHQVETATNGTAALGRLREQRFDVVVSDMKMPGMSGRDLFETLQGYDASLARRLIFTTGDLANRETMRFLESTGNPYLQKPFDLNAVRRVIYTMMNAA